MSDADALKYQYELTAVALLCLAMLIVYHLRRPTAHPRSVRGSVILAFCFAAVYPAQFLVDDSSLRVQTLYRAIMNMPVVAIIVFLCYLVATSLAQTNPRPRKVLLSAMVVLPLAWVFAFVVGLRWPLPALQEATVPTTGVMPAHFLLYKIYLPVAIVYVAVCASVFARHALASRRFPLRRQLFQNLVFLVLTLDIVLIFLNSYATAIVRVVYGATRADLIRAALTLEFVLYVSGGLSLLTAFFLYASQPDIDRLFNFCSSWVTNRRNLEAEIWRTSAAGLSASQEHRLAFLARTPSAQFLFPAPNDLQKAAYCLRLALTFSRKPSTRASGYYLLQLQHQILRLVADSNNFTSGSNTFLNYDLDNDLLNHTVRPAIDISHPKTVPNLLAAPFWQQLVVVAFAKAALQAGLISPQRARLLLDRCVTGTTIRAYESIDEYLQDNLG